MNGIDNGNGLLGSANHTVVKVLEWMMELTASLTSRSVIVTAGGVASADAQGRLAGAGGRP